MRNFSVFLLIFAVFYCIEGQATQPDYCTLPKDEGTVTDKDAQIYLHYDNTTDKCSPFRYNGAGGNQNRFNYEFFCMRNCSPSAENMYPLNRTKACNLPKAIGECLGHYIRYYYDASQRKCITFFWTGCVGNGNRFLDLAHCNATCYGISDITTDKEEDESSGDAEADTQIGIILGAVLGVTGAIVLIVVLVLTLKKPSKSKKAKAKEAKVKEDSNSPGPEIPLQSTDKP